MNKKNRTKIVAALAGALIFTVGAARAVGDDGTAEAQTVSHPGTGHLPAQPTPAGTSTTRAVTSPSSYLLMLGGIALLGLVAVRRHDE